MHPSPLVVECTVKTVDNTQYEAGTNQYTVNTTEYYILDY